MRVRLIYSKRGGACFVPHIALAQIFSRTASRAGLNLVMTQGFSPRAKISFAPELPAGVVALAEAVEMFFNDECENLIQRMNEKLPEGFNISHAIITPEDAPSLGKSCTHAEYLIRSRKDFGIAERFNVPAVIKSDFDNGWFHFIIKDPAQNPIGSFVKPMIKENLISGWQDVNIVRLAIGLYDEISNSVGMT